MQYTLLKEYIGTYWYGMKVHVSCFWLLLATWHRWDQKHSILENMFLYFFSNKVLLQMMLPQNKEIKTWKASIVTVCQNTHLTNHLMTDSIRNMPIFSKLDNPKGINQLQRIFLHFIFSCHLLYDNTAH